MGSLILKMVIKYLEAHPDQVVSLIDAAVEALIAHLKTSNTPA